MFSIWWVSWWSYGNSVMWYLVMRREFTCRIWRVCVCVLGEGAIMLATGRRREQKIMSVHAILNMCSKTYIQQNAMKLTQCVSSWFYQRYARIQTRRPVFLFVAKNYCVISFTLQSTVVSVYAGSIIFIIIIIIIIIIIRVIWRR